MPPDPNTDPAWIERGRAEVQVEKELTGLVATWWDRNPGGPLWQFSQRIAQAMGPVPEPEQLEAGG